MKKSEFYYLYAKEILAEETAVTFLKESYCQKDYIKEYHYSLKKIIEFAANTGYIENKNFSFLNYEKEHVEGFFKRVQADISKKTFAFFEAIMERGKYCNYENDEIKCIISELNEVYMDLDKCRDKYGWGYHYYKMMEKFRLKEEKK